MSSAITSVVEKLGNLLYQEGVFLYGVKDQVKWVETELQRMQCFLEDAGDMPRKGDQRLRNWVRQVTDVAYDAEDAIDAYMLQVERRPRKHGFFARINMYASIPSLLMARHKLGKDIEEIKLTIDHISKSTITYKIGNLGETIGKEDWENDKLLESYKRPPLLHVTDYLIVGFEKYREELVNQLIKVEPERRYVVSIVGMGGLGKSTLAKMVSDDSRISKSFRFSSWVTASAGFELHSFLVDLALKTVGGKEDVRGKKDEFVRGKEDEFKKLGEGTLGEIIYDFLKDKVYFIVIDDVWGTNNWKKIERLLPDDRNGSRVLLTTRSESVAKSAEPTIPFLVLSLLTDEESWALFVRRTFPTESGVDSVCPKEFEPSGKRMVKKCGRLPLALSVLSGLLLSKTTPLSWLQVEETMDWESTKDEKLCLNILSLSYRNLPDHNLRSCFLYTTLFPEDSKISASELTRLWIAEGFIPQERRKTLEDTARGFLDDFHQRSMIQVLRRRTDGSVLRFKIHDLLREMCLVESKQDKFLNIIPSSSGGTNYNTSSNGNFSRSRRLALYNPNGEICIQGCLPSNLRSLFLRFEIPITSISKMLNGLEFLRVLEVQGPREAKWFPKPIKSMTHLRYLKLSRINELPSAIGNFRNLETLDLRNCQEISMLPKELGALPNLRHVFIRDLCFPSIGTSTNLRTLKRIVCDQLWVQESLPKLQYLSRLDILTYSGDGVALCQSISKLNHLASLMVHSREIPHSIITSLSDNPHLVKLSVGGRMVPQPWLPESGNFPPNLTKLYLWDSKVEEDPMPVLEKLPNLMFLNLSLNAYVGNKLICTTDGFLQLQTLELIELENLEDWVVQDRAFPKLARLAISSCGCLEMLPEGLQHVRSLMSLWVLDRRAEFINRLQKDVGDDWHKIKHVRNILGEVVE